MATKKQQTISRVTDLPIINKLWDGMKTIVAYDKKNFVIDTGNIAGRRIIDMSALQSEESGGKNIIYINFNDKHTDTLYVYNGSDGKEGKEGGVGPDGNQGEEGYINPNGRGVTGTLYIVNNSVTEDPNLPWSAFRGKDMNEKIYDLNEVFMSEDEFNLLFNDIKYIYAEFKTKSDEQSSQIFNADNNPHIVYKKYWTYEDEGGTVYYIYNPLSETYDQVTADLWKDIYLGNKEGYFPLTSSMGNDATEIFYFDKESLTYKTVDKVIVERETGDGIIPMYLGDKHIDEYYIPELNTSVSADYTYLNNRWSFNLNATSEYVPDVYKTDDGEHFTKMSKEDVLAIDTSIYAQYYQKVGDEYESITNIGSYLAKKAVRYYKRNIEETSSGTYVEVNNNKYCEVPESEINMDSLTEDFIIMTYTKTTNQYEFERHYPSTLYGEDIQAIETVILISIDLYYYTSDRKYYSSVLIADSEGTLHPTYVEIEIPSWLYAEFKTNDEDQISLILNANDNTAGESENNEIIDNTIENLDDTVTTETIFRIVPGEKETLYLKTADERYVEVDLSKDPIHATSEYYVLRDEYVKIENPEEYLSNYDMTIFNGEPQLLPLAIYPLTNRSYVSLEYDPEKIVFFENGRIAATIGDNYTTLITVSSENSDAKAYIHVRVTTQVKDIQFSTTNHSDVDFGESTEIEYTILPENANNKEINWDYDENLVSIEQLSEKKIKLTGTGVGKLQITANAADGFGASKSFNFEVVRPAESISWPDNSDLIIYHPAILYEPYEITRYNEIDHAQEIADGLLEPLTAESIKEPAYYSMTALLHKEYILNPIILPDDTSYKQIRWESSDSSIAAVSEKTVKIIDTPEVIREVTQEDIDENSTDANGNVLTVDQIGTEVTFIKEISHNEIQYAFMSTNTGSVEITGRLNRYPDLFVTVTVKVDQSVEEIRVSPDTLSMNINTKKKLTAEVLPNAEEVNKTIVWGSSNESVVTVVPNSGTVTAVGLGSASIIAYSQDGSGVEGRCSITVTRPTKDIYLRAETINGIIYLGIDKTTTISADVIYDANYAGGAKMGINWVITDTSIATIEDKSIDDDYKAEIKGLALGKTTIIANAKDGSGVLGSIQLEIIKLAESISFDFDEVEMEVNDSLVLIPNFDPIDTTNEIVIWSSSDETVAKVKESGIVYARQAGEAYITATTTDGTELTATCKVIIS